MALDSSACTSDIAIDKKRKIGPAIDLKTPTNRPFKQIDLGYEYEEQPVGSPLTSVSDDQSSAQTIDEAPNSDVAESARLPKVHLGRSKVRRSRALEKEKEANENAMESSTV